MSKEEDVVHDALERLEWDERKEEDTPFKKMRQVTRRTALTGGAAGIGALILQACGGSSSSSSASIVQQRTATGTASAATGGSAAAGIFGSSKAYKFTLVNHVTTNPFFTPTQNGAADACKLLGCSYQWTGSENSNVGEMVNAFNSAISAGVDGIGVALVDLHAFNAPDDKALAAKIPVVAYNADAAGNARLAYIGQDLFVSGQEMGQHIAELVPVRRRRAVHRHAGLAEHPAADRRRAGHAQEPLGDQDARRRHRRRRAGRSCRRSTPTPPATPTPRATSRSTPAAPRASRRRSRSTTCATRASRAAGMTSRRSPSSCWPPARSTSRSTSSPTCRASCRSCSSTCTR